MRVGDELLRQAVRVSNAGGHRGHRRILLLADNAGNAQCDGVLAIIHCAQISSIAVQLEQAVRLNIIVIVIDQLELFAYNIVKADIGRFIIQTERFQNALVHPVVFIDNHDQVRWLLRQAAG
ncbi:hypothetical protein D3C73_949310 [compost metagenome]